uniref:Serpin domain-containing protein n=1 Tax=Papilio xuthus TaxID=66420 RepID=I4DNY5_PAPXU|nr:unknown unsecreted protein [Papilio xuthus]
MKQNCRELGHKVQTRTDRGQYFHPKRWIPEISKIHVRDKTNRKIKNLLTPESITPASLMVLVNAVYFKGNWLLFPTMIHQHLSPPIDPSLQYSGIINLRHLSLWPKLKIRNRNF